MFHRCPKCHKKIGKFSLSCADCGWSLDQELNDEWGTPRSAQPADESADAKAKSNAALQLDTAVEAIGREDFPAALGALNAAIVDAEESCLAECYALRGYTLLKLRQFERAEQDCCTALEAGYDDDEIYAWRAAARGQLGRWREAYEDLAHARELSDEPTEFADLMAKYYEPATNWFRQRLQQPGGEGTAQAFSDRGWVHLYAGDATKAKRDFELALQQNPHLGTAMLGTAEASVRMGQFDQAVQFCDLLIQSSKKLAAPALLLQVRAAQATGQTRTALLALQKLRGLARGNPQLLAEGARLRYQIGDFVGCLEDLNDLIAAHPAAAWYKLRGETHAALNNPTLAIADYNAALKSEPSRATLWIKRGEMNVSLQRLDRALQDFDRAESLGSIREEIFLGRAKVFEAQRRYDEAIQQCKKAQRLVPDSPEVFALEGQIYFKQKLYNKSLDQLGRAIELAADPRRRAEYLYFRGVQHYELGDLHHAVEDLEEAHRLRPNHAGTMIWRAAVAARLEEWPQVIECLQKAIAIRPAAAEQYQTLGTPVAGRAVEYFTRRLQRQQDDADALRNRGMAFQFLGSYEAALSDFADSLRLEDDAMVRLRRGQVHHHLRQFSAALEDFQQILGHTEHDAPIYHTALYWKAKTHVAVGQLGPATEAIRQALERGAEQPAYHVLNALLLQRHGQVDDAIEALGQAIALDFTDHTSYFLRGKLHFKRRQYMKAIIDFCQSLDLNPNQPEVISWRGEAYFKAGQPNAALEDFELSLTHDPGLLKSYCGRALVLAERDQHERAIIWLTKAIHRFQQPAEWAQLLLTRGKIYYQMSRFLPAIADFSSVIQLKRHDPAARRAAYYARALALLQHGQLVAAQHELERVVAEQPDFPGAALALQWLSSGQGPRPAALHPPSKMIRPKRPPIVRGPLTIERNNDPWMSSPPHDGWIVRLRDAERTEYGPVAKKLLDQWVAEGRIAADTKILRSDWDKWKRAAHVYPELGPSQVPESSPSLDSLPTFQA